MLFDVDDFFIFLWCYLDVRLFNTIGFNIRCDCILSSGKKTKKNVGMISSQSRCCVSYDML
jgi:hypothetical protein